MPNYGRLAEKIEAKLTLAEKLIHRRKNYERTSKLLSDAYELFQKSNLHKSLADELYSLHDSLILFQDECPEDLPSHVHRIKSTLVNALYSQDVKNNYSESDSDLDSDYDSDADSHLNIDDTDDFDTSASEEDNSESSSEADNIDLSFDLSDEEDEVITEGKMQSVVMEARKNFISPICSYSYLRTKNNIFVTKKDKLPVTHNYETLHAEIQRISKAGIIKYRFNPSAIHHQQRVTLNQQVKMVVNENDDTVQGNTIVVDFSFEIKAIIKSATGEAIEKSFTLQFVLNVPRFNRSNDISENGSFNYHNLNANDKSTLKTLKDLYALGFAAKNNTKHGVKPKYNNSQGDSRFVRHSEQTLAAYLSDQSTAIMMANCMVSIIRAEHEDIPIGSEIKIYHMALHIHSDKTPCCACEHVLLGMQNQDDGIRLHLQAALKDKPHFKFKFPESGLKFIVLMTADTNDATHKGRKTDGPQEDKPATDASVSVISTKSPSTPKKLFTTNFKSLLPSEVLTVARADTSQRTTFLSGSNISPARNGTEKKITAVKNIELSDYDGISWNGP